MIPSLMVAGFILWAVYQRGLVIDSQLQDEREMLADSISKGIGD